MTDLTSDILSQASRNNDHCGLTELSFSIKIPRFVEITWSGVGLMVFAGKG